jgi:hypothetical protein
VRRVLIGALLAAAIALAALPTPGSAATSCGGHVTVTGPVPCYKARSIVKEFKKTRKHKIQGFKCLGTVRSGRVTEVTCREPGKRIHWKA